MIFEKIILKLETPNNIYGKPFRDASERRQPDVQRVCRSNDHRWCFYFSDVSAIRFRIPSVPPSPRASKVYGSYFLFNAKVASTAADSTRLCAPFADSPNFASSCSLRSPEDESYPASSSRWTSRMIARYVPMIRRVLRILGFRNRRIDVSTFTVTNRFIIRFHVVSFSSI